MLIIIVDTQYRGRFLCS